MTTKNNPFFSLCRTIVGQQISTKAADSIWEKFEKKCKKNIKPKTILSIKNIAIGIKYNNCNAWAVGTSPRNILNPNKSGKVNK